MKKRARGTVEEEEEEEEEEGQKSEKRDMCKDENDHDDDNDHDDEEEKTERESEDWCFICKDGGKLQICDHRECIKAYHSGCLKKRKLSLPISKLPWHCSRHKCSNCQNRSTFFCYCCPTALCNDCLDSVYFLLIKGQYGFCHKCRKLALFVEEENEEDLSRSQIFFKEYYDIVKKDEGFSLKDLQSPEEQSEQKCKSSSNLSSGCDSTESLDSRERTTKLKIVKGQRNRKFNYSRIFQNEAVAACKAPEVLFASIVPDNIKLVYLKRSLVQEVLKEPESFEGKVEGSYVRVESCPSDGRWSNSYQLMPVIGVKKDSNGQDIDVKLQLLGWPNDVSINSLSDANFSEAECEILGQKMKAGLIKKPTVDELGGKARSLHKDIIDHMLSREKRTLQCKIDFANEKGRRLTLFQLLERRKLLEAPEHRHQLLNTPPNVIPELLEPSNELKDASKFKSISKHTDGQTKINGSPRSIPINNEHGGDKTALDASEIESISKHTDEQKKTNSSPRSITIHNEHGGNEAVLDASEIESVSKHTDEQKKTNGSPRSIPIHNEHGGNETALVQSSSNAHEENPAFIVDVDLDKLLKELIKPDVSCSHAIAFSTESVQLKDDLLLSLKKIPISDFRSMIKMANVVFKHFNELPINYTSFYGRVRNYIRCSSLLASTEEFKQCSSTEVLAANYASSKKYSAMAHEGIKNLSTYMNEVFTTLQDLISDTEMSLVKLEVEHLVNGKARQSVTLRGMLEKLKCTQNTLMNDLVPPMQNKKECCFEDVWEAFLNAKGALCL